MDRDLLDEFVEQGALFDQIRIMQNHHQLTRDLTSPVEDFPEVARKLAAMKYAGVVASEEETEADDERAVAAADEVVAPEGDASSPEVANQRPKSTRKEAKAAASEDEPEEASA